PGETKAHFQAILDLMAEVRFDHVGIFPFFPEEGTPAAALPGQVSDRTKQRRKRRALELQQRISLERNQAFVGAELEVLVDGRCASPPPGRTTCSASKWVRCRTRPADWPAWPAWPASPSSRGRRASASSRCLCSSHARSVRAVSRRRGGGRPRRRSGAHPLRW